MSQFSPSSSLVAAGIRYTLLAGDSLFLRAGLTLGSSDMGAVVVTGANAGIWIDGTLSAAGAAVQASGDHLQLRLSSSGSLSSQDAIGAIQSSGSLLLDNAGSLTASRGAGVVAQQSATVINSGTLTSALAGVIGSASADLITNSGILKSLSGLALALGYGDDVVANTGRIVGAIRLGAGNDTLTLGGGTGVGYVNGSIYGDDGNDSLEGALNKDTLFGGHGDDLLLGRSGDDFLSGDTGADRLHGGDGADRLLGGDGEDVMLGGAGADSFLFSGIIKTNGDRIADFATGVDRLVLSRDLVAASSATVDWHSLVTYDAATGQLRGDADGNGSVDWLILLGGKPAFSYDDIIIS